MSITFTKAYVSNGNTYATLEQAQVAEIEAMLENVSVETVATTLVANADRVIDILTTTDSSRPKARAVNGGRKPRKKKNASPELPLDPGV